MDAADESNDRIEAGRAESARSALMGDRHRPVYHFLPAANWLNDPNGVIQWRGEYHLFYQYNPAGAFHGTIHWGHAVSSDLAHWRDLPMALTPTPGTPDADGCWSGCAIVHDGVPTLIYTGFRAGEQRPCLATSTDNLLTWQKYAGNPIIDGPPADLDVVGFRDHSVWKEDTSWYQAVGSGIKGQGGAALLYRSPNLIDWKYLHPLLADESEPGSPEWLSEMWECPDFFRLDGMCVLALSIISPRRLHYPAFLTGDYVEQRFVPRHRGLLDLGPSFYAPLSMTDEQGRRIMWGWLRERRTDAAQRAAGWSGVMSLPRLLSPRDDGNVGMTPAPELQTLRRAEFRLDDLALIPDTPNPLATLRGDTLEIVLECEIKDDTALGLKVYQSPRSEEEVLILFERPSNRLSLDPTRASLSSDVLAEPCGGHVPLKGGETLRLHIFLDRSVIELFANEVTCLTERVYPTRADSHGLELFVQGTGATIKRLQVWELATIWEGEA